MTDARTQVVLGRYQKKSRPKKKRDKKTLYQQQKRNSLPLADAYDYVNPSKAERIRSCANVLTVETYENERQRYTAQHCFVRLCPVCGWKRSDKITGQLFKEIGAIRKDYPNYRYIFITLTMRNCLPQELNDALTQMLSGFNRMMHYKCVRAMVKGYCRSLEITHKLENDTYHPHIHAIIAVDQHYFTDSSYLNQVEWTSLWKKALKANYSPRVHVTKIKGSIAKAVLETAKYSVKSADYIVPNDWEFTLETVRTLDSALHNRRFLGLGGVFKEAHKKLKLSDPEDINTDDDQSEELPIDVRHYAWCSVYRQYNPVNL